MDFVAAAGLNLAVIALYNGDLERENWYLEEALVQYREIGNNGLVAYCLFFKAMFAMTQGLYDQADELNEDAGHIAQKIGSPEPMVLYIRARLARLCGESVESVRYAEEGLNVARGSSSDDTMLLLLELGHLALQEGDWRRAGTFMREGLQIIIHMRELNWLGFMLDGLAVLSVSEGKLERAARLFGTRLWRGFAHILSPIERDAREADLAEIKATLGEERFAKLRAEGYALDFLQVLALAQEE